jgi:hypothetical protein
MDPNACIETIKNDQDLSIKMFKEIIRNRLTGAQDILTYAQEGYQAGPAAFKNEVASWATAEKNDNCVRLMEMQQNISVFFFWVRLIITCLMAITISIIWLSLGSGSQDERLGISITTLILGILVLIGLGYTAAKKGSAIMIQGGGWVNYGNILIFMVATMSAVASFRLNAELSSSSDWAKVSAHFGSLSVVSMVLSLTSMGILKV